MARAQPVGLDLPLKALAWQDAQGQVWLGHNDPAYLAKRHTIASCPALAQIGKVLAGLVAEAVAL